jgi:Domain of unknown function (DUF4442)
MRKFRRWLRLAINMWPPFLGAGIRVKSMDPALRAIDVEMRLRFWNRNYVGTHYGGSLYSMVDPFFMVMLIENLGPDYVVWDKAATIRFKKPGRGKMFAAFRLSDSQLDQIRQDAALHRKLEPTFTVEVRDELGDVVAEVDKVIYIRLRSALKADS